MSVWFEQSRQVLEAMCKWTVNHKRIINNIKERHMIRKKHVAARSSWANEQMTTEVS